MQNEMNVQACEKGRTGSQTSALIKWDGHTHTHFCRHGSKAHMSQYIERAIELDFDRYSVTEHPPLPAGWIQDKALFAELAMEQEELPAYFECLIESKQRYADRIEVGVGLELDYLPGKESFTAELIDRWGDRLEDVVMSVHYLPGVDGMRCIDFTPADFEEGLLRYYGSAESVVEEYFNHVEAAIELVKQYPAHIRKRIGHLCLIEKFRLALPPFDEAQISKRLDAVLPKLIAAGIGVDVNIAGFRKDTCRKPYVPEWFLAKCIEHGVECVYGSDSHDPGDVGKEWEWFERSVRGYD